MASAAAAWGAMPTAKSAKSPSRSPGRRGPRGAAERAAEVAQLD